MTAGPPEDDGMPETVGPYRIRRRIGQGGMGVVYQGMNENDELVAIKVLRPEVAGDDIARARLAREVETMRRVNSRNVARVLAADTNARRPWVVTEYIPGPTLDDTVTNHGPLRGRALTRLVSGLAQALSDIHDAEIIHRDLKPGNVIISNGEPIVIDFGIAHAVDSAKLTQTGTFVGTPSYLSPEVIEGTDLSSATDIHAWGATVAFAATGNAPYGAGAFEVIFFRILNSEIDLTGMPEELAPLVQRAVSRDLSQRPSARQLLDHTARLNLDLPLPPEARGVAGVTGPHTVHGAAPGDPQPSSDGAGAAGGLGAAGAAGAAGVAGAAAAGAGGAGSGSPDATGVAAAGGLAPTGGANETRQGEAAPQTHMEPQAPDANETASGAQEPPREQSAAPQTAYYNSTLRPEAFEDLLPPVDARGRRQPARQDDATSLQGEPYDSGQPQPYFDPDFDKRGPRRLPSLILIPVLFIVVGLAQMLPTLGLFLGLLGVSVLGAMDVVRSDHARRLMERGPRSSDNMVVVFSFPVAFLRVAGKALMYGAAYLLGGLLVGMIIGLLTDTFNPTYVGAYAVSIVVLLSFVGPNAAGARRQATSLLENIGISNSYVYIALIVGVCLLAFGSIGIGITVAPDWRPIPDPGGWFG